MNTLAISIDWGSLGQVAVASLAFGVGIVAIFSIGVTAMSRREDARAGSGGSVQLVVAGLCFLACAAAVLYGLYLIIPQFH